MIDKSYNLICGDALEVMKTLADNSVDSIVTDPPYFIGFMNKQFDTTKDNIAARVELWREAERVLKPGGHLLAFGASRTHHRLFIAIEDAGFEIRDTIVWLFGSGFPKNLDVSKQLDKLAGAERKVVGLKYVSRDLTRNGRKGDEAISPIPVVGTFLEETLPTSDEAKQWQGFGTALKPAAEYICLARKPLEKGLTVAQNVLKWGTGAINVEASRVGNDVKGARATNSDGITRRNLAFGMKEFEGNPTQGRFPANVIHDGSDEVEAEFARYGERKSGAKDLIQSTWGTNGIYSKGKEYRKISLASSGTASRFFYAAKASKLDRNEGLEGFEKKKSSKMGDGIVSNCGDVYEGRTQSADRRAENFHPCVKPFLLMSYLCRLITPPNGIVLDMFAGSGSTGKAAIAENFKFIGIEQDADYLKIAEARIEAALNKQPLFAAA